VQARLVAAVALVLAYACPPQCHAHDDTFLGWFILASTTLPSELGADLAVGGTSRSRGVLGWSWQVPLSPRLWAVESRHRAVVDVDMLASGDSVSWRGRLGYRYARHRFFGGVGPALDAGGVTVSPELGFKFLLTSPDDHDSGFALHALVRAGLDTSGFQTVTLTLGWNVL
jgi:hypothetical protein